MAFPNYTQYSQFLQSPAVGPVSLGYTNMPTTSTIAQQDGYLNSLSQFGNLNQLTDTSGILGYTASPQTPVLNSYANTNIQPFVSSPDQVQSMLAAGGKLAPGVMPDSVDQAAALYAVGNKQGFDWFSDGNLKTAAVGIQGLQALGNMYMGYKGLDLAKDQFAFQKGLAEKNMANSIKNYNTELAHKAKMRYAGQKSAADIDAYVSANSL